MAKNDLMSIDVDIGKDVFHLVGFVKESQLVLRKKIKRMAMMATFESLPRYIVDMEACLSAHIVSRTLCGLGFGVWGLSLASFQRFTQKRFNKGQKNDYNDAEAIAEAALCPNLKTVPYKMQKQLD